MKRVKKIAAYLFLTVASVISVFPLYWMISAATNNSTDVLGGIPLPGLHLIENYKELILQQQKEFDEAAKEREALEARKARSRAAAKKA